MKKALIAQHERDNVATALADLTSGEEVLMDLGEGTCVVRVSQAIAFGHKFALQAIAAGQDVVKYGEVIGVATAEIAQGEHVHVQNVASKRGRGDLAQPKKEV